MSSVPIWKQYGFESEEAFRERYPEAAKSDSATSLRELFTGEKQEPREMTQEEFLRQKREAQEIDYYNNLNPHIARMRFSNN